MTKAEFTPVVNALESNIDAALARIRELEAQLAEANARAEKAETSAKYHESHSDFFSDKLKREMADREKAEAEATRLRGALMAIHERARLGGGEAGLAGEQYALLDIFTLAQAALRPQESAAAEAREGERGENA